ncbi:unnamed protein product [Ectocarpus sp. 12 AP-2014]
MSEIASATGGKHHYPNGIDMGEGNLRFPQIISASTDAGRAWFARGWMHMLNYTTTRRPQSASGHALRLAPGVPWPSGVSPTL